MGENAGFEQRKAGEFILHCAMAFFICSTLAITMLLLPPQTTAKLLLSFPFSFLGVELGARVSYLTAWPQSHYVTKNSLECFNLLPLPPWCVPLPPVYGVGG